MKRNIINKPHHKSRHGLKTKKCIMRSEHLKLLLRSTRFLPTIRNLIVFISYNISKLNQWRIYDEVVRFHWVWSPIPSWPKKKNFKRPFPSFVKLYIWCAHGVTAFIVSGLIFFTIFSSIIIFITITKRVIGKRCTNSVRLLCISNTKEKFPLTHNLILIKCIRGKGGFQFLYIYFFFEYNVIFFLIEMASCLLNLLVLQKIQKLRLKTALSLLEVNTPPLPTAKVSNIIFTIASTILKI